MKKVETDFTLGGGGSIYILTPNNPAAQEWLKDYVITEETQTWGTGIVVEHRYVGDILNGLVNDGLSYA